MFGYEEATSNFTHREVFADLVTQAETKCLFLGLRMEGYYFIELFCLFHGSSRFATLFVVPPHQTMQSSNELNCTSFNFPITGHNTHTSLHILEGKMYIPTSKIDRVFVS